MSTPETPGALLHGADADARREAARLMGQATSEKKAAAARATAAARKGAKWTEEQKENLRKRRAELREQKLQAAGEAGATPSVAVEKKRPGRPRKEPADVEPTGERRGRGRPRKQEGTEATA